MVTVQWNSGAEKYEVLRRGSVLSRHNKASAAKDAGKRAGKKYGEPVSYSGKRGASKFIYRPDPEEQFGNGGGDGGGLLGGWL